MKGLTLTRGVKLLIVSMGLGGSKLDKHIQHYHRPDENKLWMYAPTKETLKCYSVRKGENPFFFGGLQSISVPDLGAIFVIGGLWADDTQVNDLIKKYRLGEVSSNDVPFFNSLQDVTDVIFQ